MKFIEMKNLISGKAGADSAVKFSEYD